jgi:hypothetical protein
MACFDWIPTFVGMMAITNRRGTIAQHRNDGHPDDSRDPLSPNYRASRVSWLTAAGSRSSSG